MFEKINIFDVNENAVKLFKIDNPIVVFGDINKHNQEDSKKVEKVFKPKFPTITYAILAINIIIFVSKLVIIVGEQSVCND